MISVEAPSRFLEVPFGVVINQEISRGCNAPRLIRKMGLAVFVSIIIAL